jgi:hypothetical protein
MRSAPFVLAAFVAAPALAQDTVWRCTEGDGRQHYTNIKKETEGKTCQVVTKEVSVVPAPSTPAPRNRSAAGPTAPAATASAATTPPGFPRVDADTQRARDEARRKILQDELATEEKSLAEARAKLVEQESVRHGDERNYQRVLDRLKPFQEAVDRHERNVAALKKELGALR